MFLSKLKIIGFKSFPDKTILNFSDGTTSIVGPNGCGKTNIVDAIRWVLGEQKASVLRSSKMEEVIFNGTQKKKPLGFCEVSITIENNKKLLPIEYDTIELTRRYFRSGDSEYYINKTQCRLKDIHDMFVDTGMSSGAYSVIELKMIESILSQNPSDRRSMIDEAAGINNYNKQKASSTRRLVATKSDMERIFDIMKEVESNVKKLKLQLKRYDRHSMLSAELKASEYMYNKNTINTLDEKLKPLSMSLDQKNKTRENFEKELNKQEINLDLIQKKFEKTRTEMNSIQTEIKVIEDLIMQNNQNIIIATEQIGHSNSRIDHFNNEISVKNDQLRLIDNDILNMKKDINQLMPDFTKCNNEYEKISAQKLAVEKELSELIKLKQKNRNKLQNISSKISFDKNQIDSNNRLVSEKSNLILSLKKEIHLSVKIQDDTKEKYDNCKIELEKINKDNKNNDFSLSKLNQKILNNNQVLEDKSNEYTTLNHSVKVIENRINFYKRVLVSKDGMISGNKHLSDNITKFPGVLGKLSELFSSSNKYMRAISVALGDYSDYVVVDTLDNALSITKKLVKKEMSFNIIALDQISKNNLNITDKHLMSHLKIKNRFKDLFESLLGDYMLTDSLDTNMNKKYSYICLNGDVKCKSGAIKLNSNFESSKMSLNIEINKLKKEIDGINNNLVSKVLKKIEEVKEQQEKLSREVVKKTKEIEIGLSKMNEIRINIEQKKFIISEHYKQTRSTQLSIGKLEKEIIDFELKNKSLYSSVKLNQKILRTDEKESIKLSNKINKLESTMLSIRQEIQKKNIDLIEISNKKNTIQNRIKDQSSNAEKIKSDISRYSDEVKKLAALIKKLEISKRKYKDNLKRIHKKESHINKTKYKLETNYSTQYEQFQNYQVEIRKNRAVKESTVEDLNKLIIEIEKIKAEKDLYFSLISEIDINSLNEDYLAKINKFSLDQLSHFIEKNNKSIERIGPVNMEVGEQHKAEIERYDFLESQYTDLLKSKKSLEEAITKLDSEARNRFNETFEKIKLNFSKTYNMFYEKGKASLELKGEDVLDSEIIINATPPGKTTQSLRMLSGGEKAITAISLLFAIYLVKPSPFCILDEVDAPLDDINIKQFISVIKEFSKNSQFIIVTHNKLTMEGSDYLYGVTQVNQGVSTIVSVNLKDVDSKILA